MFHVFLAWQIQSNVAFFWWHPPTWVRNLSNPLIFLLLSIKFLTLIDYKEHSQQSSILKLSSDNLNWFHALQKVDKQLQMVSKLLRKQGKNSDGIH